MVIQRRSPRKPADALLSLALVLAIVLIAVVSLTPVRVASSWAEVKTALEQSITLSLGDAWLATVAERVITFLPLGLLIHWKLVGLRWHLPRIRAMLFVVMVALVIECAQAVLTPSRHARVADFLLAAGAGMLGVASGALVLRLRSSIRLLTSGSLVLGNLLVLVVVAAAHDGADLGRWDCGYPLLVANELTQDRPWRGRIWGVALYPRGITDDEIFRLSRVSMTPENTPVRIEAGVRALYLFTAPDRNRVPQLAPDGPTLALMMPQAGREGWRIENGVLDIQGPVLIRSTEPATELCNAILHTQAFTLEVTIASSDLAQGGPARIVSMSKNTLLRNFTLGEEEGTLDFRLRTNRSGVNGTRLALQTDKEPLAGGVHHVVARYARGTAELFVDGLSAAPAMPHYGMLLLGEDAIAVPVGLLVGPLFLLMGVAAVFAFARRPVLVALPLGFGTAMLVPLLFSVSIAAWLERDLDLALLAAALVATALGLGVGWILRARYGSEGPPSHRHPAGL